MNARPGDFYDGFGRHLTFRQLEGERLQETGCAAVRYQPRNRHSRRRSVNLPSRHPSFKDGCDGRRASVAVPNDGGTSFTRGASMSVNHDNFAE